MKNSLETYLKKKTYIVYNLLNSITYKKKKRKKNQFLSNKNDLKNYFT